MKWKCKMSGNIIDLPESESHTMEGHDGYEKVEDDVQGEKPPVQKQPKVKKEVTE